MDGARLCNFDPQYHLFPSLSCVSQAPTCSYRVVATAGTDVCCVKACMNIRPTPQWPVPWVRLTFRWCAVVSGAKSTFEMPPMSSWWCVWQHAGEGDHTRKTGAVVTTAVAIAAVVMTAVEASCSFSCSVC